MLKFPNPTYAELGGIYLSHIQIPSNNQTKLNTSVIQATDFKIVRLFKAVRQ